MRLRYAILVLILFGCAPAFDEHVAECRRLGNWTIHQDCARYYHDAYNQAGNKGLDVNSKTIQKHK